MIGFDSAGTTVVTSGARGACWLVDMEFVAGTTHFTTYNLPITANGNTYSALGHLGSVGTVSESQDASAERMTLSLSIVDTAMIAAAITNPSNYRGRRARLWLQLIDDQFQPAGVPRLRWTGYMDKVAINRKPNKDGKGTGSIEMQCSRAGMARARKAPSLRLTDEQQRARYSGDTGLRYVRGLIEKPALWLSKAFQKQD